MFGGLQTTGSNYPVGKPKNRCILFLLGYSGLLVCLPPCAQGVKKIKIKKNIVLIIVL